MPDSIRSSHSCFPLALAVSLVVADFRMFSMVDLLASILLAIALVLMTPTTVAFFGICFTCSGTGFLHDVANATNTISENKVLVSVFICISFLRLLR